MRLPLIITTLLALGALGACGENHRTEEFCATLCECQGGVEADQQACTAQCTAVIEPDPNSELASPISDECFACVSNNSCLVAESLCANDCAALSDIFNTPDPEPLPAPGDQSN